MKGVGEKKCMMSKMTVRVKEVNHPWQSVPYADNVQDFRRQDTKCRAGHDQGPHGYPVLEVGPMEPSIAVLTSIVTLSL